MNWFALFFLCVWKKNLIFLSFICVKNEKVTQTTKSPCNWIWWIVFFYIFSIKADKQVHLLPLCYIDTVIYIWLQLQHDLWHLIDTHTHTHCTYTHRSVTTKKFFFLYFTISSSNSWTLNSIFIEWIALTHSKIEVKNFYFSFYSCNCTNFSCECVVVVDKKKN